MLDRIKERLPYPENPGKTHWEGCWRDRGHHNCAVLEITRLRTALQLAPVDAVEHEDQAQRVGQSVLSSVQAEGPELVEWAVHIDEGTE